MIQSRHDSCMRSEMIRSITIGVLLLYKTMTRRILNSFDMHLDRLSLFWRWRLFNGFRSLRERFISDSFIASKTDRISILTFSSLGVRSALLYDTSPWDDGTIVIDWCLSEARLRIESHWVRITRKELSLKCTSKPTQSSVMIMNIHSRREAKRYSDDTSG